MNYSQSNRSGPCCRRPVRLGLAGALLLTLAACAGLPPPQRPSVLESPQAQDFRLALRQGDWPERRWWRSLGDPQLSALIEEALREAPNLKVAQARLAQAQAASAGVAASAGARLELDGDAAREQFSGRLVYPPPYAGAYLNPGQVDLNASYDFDFWGRNRQALQAALGERDAAEAETEATAVALSTSVARAYFQWQTLQARQQLTQKVQAEREALVALEAARVKAGLTARESLHPLDAEASAPAQSLVQLATQLEQTRYQLKALVGAHELPELRPVALPDWPAAAPEQLHLDLLAHRPDVAAARDRVLAAEHDIESARAAFYPDFSISAFLGLNSLQISQLLNHNSREMGVSPALHLPLFDAGRLRARLQSSQADQGLAVAQYAQTVQNAVAEVNDALIHAQGLAQEQSALQAQQRARQQSIDSALRRAAAGLSDQREVHRNRLAALALEDQALQWQSQTVAAHVDLIKALGGGWTARPAPH